MIQQRSLRNTFIIEEAHHIFGSYVLTYESKNRHHKEKLLCFSYNSVDVDDNVPYFNLVNVLWVLEDKTLYDMWNLNMAKNSYFTHKFGLI